MDGNVDLKYFYDKLLRRKEKLEEILTGLKESVKPVKLDQASVGRLSRMDAIQQQSMALATEKRLQQDFSPINLILSRFHEQTYGVSIRCGDAIPSQRLDLDPSVLLCVECLGTT